MHQCLCWAPLHGMMPNQMEVIFCDKKYTCIFNFKQTGCSNFYNMKIFILIALCTQTNIFFNLFLNALCLQLANPATQCHTCHVWQYALCKGRDHLATLDFWRFLSNYFRLNVGSIPFLKISWIYINLG